MKRDSRETAGDGAGRRSPATLAAPATSVAISIILPIGTVRQLAAPEIRDALYELLKQLSEGARRLRLADVPAHGEDQSYRACENPRRSKNAARAAAAVEGLTSDIAAVRNFISARCEIGSYRESAASLKAEYEKWAAANDAPPLTKKSFGRALAELAYTRKQSNVIFWCGLRLKPTSSSG